MREMTIILASGSPRRLQLLQQIGLDPIVIPSRKEEHPSAKEPAEIVKELSIQKASDIADQVLCYWKEHYGSLLADAGFDGAGKGGSPQGDTVVIGSDTVVAVEGKVLGKPKTHAQAADMIRAIQGRTHSVFTGVTLIRLPDKKTVTFAEETKVQVFPMTDEEIAAYASSDEPMDKAGAYGIQGPFAAYIGKIEGEYNTVVGLPVGHLYRELKKLMRHSHSVDRCKC